MAADAHVAKKAGRKKGKSVPKASKRVPKRAAKASRAKAPKRGKRGGMNKAAFVRSQPRVMSAKEIVAAAAKAGIPLTADYVHKVRSATKAAKRAAGKRSIPKGRSLGRRKGQHAAKNSAGGASHEIGFRKLVLDLGLQEAKRMLQEVERKLGAFIAAG